MVSVVNCPLVKNLNLCNLEDLTKSIEIKTETYVSLNTNS